MRLHCHSFLVKTRIIRLLVRICPVKNRCELSSSLFCQQEASSTITYPCQGACEEAGIKVRSDQEFAWTSWSPSLIKYMENTPNSVLARPCKCSLRTSNSSLVRRALHAVCATRSKCLHMSPNSTQWRILGEQYPGSGDVEKNSQPKVVIIGAVTV